MVFESNFKDSFLAKSTKRLPKYVDRHGPERATPVPCARAV